MVELFAQPRKNVDSLLGAGREREEMDNGGRDWEWGGENARIIDQQGKQWEDVGQKAGENK